MLRWGVLGTGFISGTVIEAVSASDGSVVEAIAGRNVDRVAEMAQAHGVARTFVGYDAIVSDPDIDVIYVGTPNHTHHQLVIAASNAGKAVLSEKSLTTTMSAAVALAEAVRANGTFFVEGLMYLAHPLIARLIEVLDDGRLGQLRSINARYAADIAAFVNPAGRGTIYNLGCYPASLVQLVVQHLGGTDAFTDRQITGVGNQSVADGTVTDAAMSLRFGDGVLATIQSSDCYGNSAEFSIAGDDGVLSFVTNPWLPKPGANTISWLPHDTPPTDAELITVDDPHDAFFHQVKLVEANVAEGRTEVRRPSPRIDDSLELMALLTEWEQLCLR